MEAATTSNQTRKRTSSLKMKAPSSSVYRKIEQLMYWASDVIDRTPNTTSFRCLGKKAMLDMEESLDLVDLAIHSKYLKMFISYLDGVSIRMRDLKTIFKFYRNKSMNPAERTLTEIGTPVPSRCRVLTSKQYATFITQMFDIAVELNQWIERKTGKADSLGSHPED